MTATNWKRAVNYDWDAALQHKNFFGVLTSGAFFDSRWTSCSRGIVRRCRRARAGVGLLPTLGRWSPPPGSSSSFSARIDLVRVPKRALFLNDLGGRLAQSTVHLCFSSYSEQNGNFLQRRLDSVQLLNTFQCVL